MNVSVWKNVLKNAPAIQNPNTFDASADESARIAGSAADLAKAYRAERLEKPRPNTGERKQLATGRAQAASGAPAFRVDEPVASRGLWFARADGKDENAAPPTSKEAAEALRRSSFKSTRFAETGYFPEPTAALGNYTVEPPSPPRAAARDATPAVWDWIKPKPKPEEAPAPAPAAADGPYGRPRYTTSDRVIEYTTLDALRREAHAMARDEVAAAEAAAKAPPKPKPSAWEAVRTAQRHHAALSAPRGTTVEGVPVAAGGAYLGGNPRRPTGAGNPMVPEHAAAVARVSAETQLLSREFAGVGDRLRHELVAERHARREAEAREQLARKEHELAEARLEQARVHNLT